MVETACGAESLVLAEVFDGDIRVCAGAVLDEVAEDGLVIVADDEDFADLWESGDCGEAVLDDRMAGDFEEWLPTSMSSLRVLCI